jgi:hypothetical protein
MSHLDGLRSADYFFERLPHSIRNGPILAHELLNEVFVTFCIETSAFDTLAALASNGPYPVIDKVIVTRLDNFGKLSKLQIRNLSCGRMINAEASHEWEAIRIPALTRLLSTLRLPTLFDLSVVARYMIENEFVAIGDQSFAEFDVQYLSLNQVNLLIDQPKILRQITNPEFPHEDVYQFQKGRESSTAFVSFPASFDFFVEKFEGSAVLAEFGQHHILRLEKNALVTELKSVPISQRVWNHCTISHLTISINGDAFCTLPDRPGHFVLGSSIPPKSTFYVRRLHNALIQIGDGTLLAKYRGFIHFAPLIDAVPRIFDNLMNAKDVERFYDWFESLLNVRHWANRVNLLGILRMVLTSKSGFVTPKIIQDTLLCCVISNQLDWNLFRIIFLDYEFWRQCSAVKTFDLRCILHSFTADQHIAFAFLFYFFIDLGSSNGVDVDHLDDFLVRIFQPSLPFVLSLLNPKPSKLVAGLLAKPTILDAVPLAYAGQLPQSSFFVYLSRYANACIEDEKKFDEKGLLELIPVIVKSIDDCEM